MRIKLTLVVVALLVLSCVGAYAAPKALYWVDLDQGTNPFLAAFADLGYDVTIATGAADYNTQLGAGGWDLTALLLQNNTWQPSDFANLPTYITGGGKAIFTDWTRNATMGDWFGVTYTGNVNMTPITLAGPFGAGTMDLTNPGWGVWSMGMALNGASSGGTFANGDVAIAYTSNTVINGWLKDTALDPAIGLDMVKREITQVTGGVPPRTPELSTWALLACSGLVGVALRRRRKS